MRAYTEEISKGRSAEYVEYRIAFDEKPKDKKTVLLIIERCPSGCMPIWVKNKIFKEPFAWWHISTYVENDKGCYGRFNPQEMPMIRRNHKGKIVEHHNIVNFDWVLPATEENRQKIIAEVSRMAFGE